MPVKYSELEKELRKINCRIERRGQRHNIWYSPVTGEKFPVGHHKTDDVPTGTLKAIKQAAGLK